MSIEQSQKPTYETGPFLNITLKIRKPELESLVARGRQEGITWQAVVRKLARGELQTEAEPG